MSRKPYISIIVPVYNGDRYLATTLEKMIQFLQRFYIYNYEIIIVNNGSTDETKFVCDIYTHTFNHIYALHLPMRGKGAAVKRGMLFAKGHYRYMCDVDLSTPITWISKFVECERMTAADVVIGSREVSRNQRVTTTPARHFIGRAFHLLASDIVPGIQDTQCGFKLFRERAAVDIFSRLQTTGLAFDVEVIYLARLLGYSVHEIPVKWDHNPNSSLHMVRDSLQMAADVIQIPWRHMSQNKGLPLTPESAMPSKRDPHAK